MVVDDGERVRPEPRVDDESRNRAVPVFREEGERVGGDDDPVTALAGADLHRPGLVQPLLGQDPVAVGVQDLQDPFGVGLAADGALVLPQTHQQRVVPLTGRLPGQVEKQVGVEQEPRFQQLHDDPAEARIQRLRAMRRDVSASSGGPAAMAGTCRGARAISKRRHSGARAALVLEERQRHFRFSRTCRDGRDPGEARAAGPGRPMFRCRSARHRRGGAAAPAARAALPPPCRQPAPHGVPDAFYSRVPHSTRCSSHLHGYRSFLLDRSHWRITG